MDSKLLFEAGSHPTWHLPRAEKFVSPNPERLEKAYHFFAGGRIPYLPTSEELFTPHQPDFLAREIYRRFVFLAETVAGLNLDDVVALRMINEPSRSPRYPRLELFLLVKCARQDPEEAQHEATALWEIMCHAFPCEFPFGFPLIELRPEELKRQVKDLAPGRVNLVVEFLKYWDVGVAVSEAFPHPYRQTPVLHNLTPMFAAISASQQRLSLTISLRPCGLWRSTQAAELYTRMSSDHLNDDRFELLQDSANRLDERMEDVALSRAAQVRRERDRLVRQSEQERLRARLGEAALGNLLRNQHRLLDMRVVLACKRPENPGSVIQAIRATLNGEIVSFNQDVPLYCSPPEARSFTSADEKDFKRLLDDLAWLEHSQIAATDNSPWRTLVTPEEAASLFSLPMPPEFGQIPGILVQTQPFVLPVEHELDNGGGPVIGTIWERGQPTSHLARIPINKLDQHVLVAGRSGSGKTNACLVLLMELARMGVDFLVLDPLDKRDYRLLLGDGLMDDLPWQTPRKPDALPLNQTLRIYTLGHPASPFTFNPFRVPPGVTVQKHISQLLRCFLTAFVVGDPIPAIYRAALRRVYESRGLKMEDEGGAGKTFPTFAQFYETLDDVVDRRSADYSTEIRSNIRQMTRLRIGSLLEDNASILNVAPDDDRDPLPDLVYSPTVLELGHIGSDEDKALIMAFLLTCLMPHIQNRRPRRLHVTVIEEAHRLMRRGGTSNELRGDVTGQTRSDFSNLLAEVRGYKQGIIVADQSPAELVASVFSNTATHVMYQIRDPQSFDMMAAAFVLSPAQMSFARRLAIGEAITETPQGAPIHIYSPNISDALRDTLENARLENDIPYFDQEVADRLVSDTAVSEIMRSRHTRMPKAELIPDYEALSTHRKTATDRGLSKPAWLPRAAPFVHCAGCQPLWKEGRCLHANRVQQFISDTEHLYPLERQIVTSVEDSGKRSSKAFWQMMRTLGPQISAATGAPPGQEAEVVYCYLTHLANRVAKASKPERRSKAEIYLAFLAEFHQNYLPSEITERK